MVTYTFEVSMNHPEAVDELEPANHVSYET
jgi:hypothetical protein